jgi:hypothetical protein
VTCIPALSIHIVGISESRYDNLYPEFAYYGVQHTFSLESHVT